MNKREFKALLSMDKKELINIILKQDIELKEKDQDILYLVSRCVQHGNKIEEQNNKLIESSIRIDDLKEEIKELNHTIKELREEIKEHEEYLSIAIEKERKLHKNDIEFTVNKLNILTNEFMYNILQNDINNITSDMLRCNIEFIEEIKELNTYVKDNSYDYLDIIDINNDLETLKSMNSLLQGKIEYIDYIEDIGELEDIEDIENDKLNTLFSNIQDTIEDIEALCY